MAGCCFDFKENKKVVASITDTLRAAGRAAVVQDISSKVSNAARNSDSVDKSVFWWRLAKLDNLFYIVLMQRVKNERNLLLISLLICAI